MGTTCTSKPANVKQYMDDIYTFKRSDGTMVRVIDSAIVALSEYYAAVEEVKPTGVREVWAGVAKLTFSKGDYGFCYKTMSEREGPYYVRCPKRIMRQLTPLVGDTHFAPDWRAGVARYWEQMKRVQALKVGDVIKFSEPLELGGVEEDTFLVGEWRRRRTGRPVKTIFAESVGLYKLPKQRSFTLVNG